MLKRLRKALQQVGDPRKAATMQAYMKSAMPYHGVPAPQLRTIFRTLFADVQFVDSSQWQSQVLDLWHGARYREERYAALLLSGHKQAVRFQTPRVLKLYEELILTGAWWDYVDNIASDRVGPILRGYPDSMRRKMLTWSRSGNLWKRRTSIICQLGSKQATDLDLLYSCIESSLDSSEFFLRKAIGWALRQYARTDPVEIKRYVRKHRARLSPLSAREALKNI